MAARASSTFPTIIAIRIQYEYFWSQDKFITYKKTKITNKQLAKAGCAKTHQSQHKRLEIKQQ